MTARRAADLVRRRALCGAAGWALLPRPARARDVARHARIAVLGGSSGLHDPATARTVEPLRSGLRERGWVEGRNLAIEWRFAEGRLERLPALLAEALAAAPDVLVTSGPRPALLARDATRSLPIVAVAVDDPVQMGLAQSYSRPGGNITGAAGAFDGILARRLQLLRDLLPASQRFALLMNPLTLQRAMLERGLAEERKSGLQITVFEASRADEFEAVFAAIGAQRFDAVLVLADALFYVQRERLGALCTQQRLPSVWGGRAYLDGGGLLSFQGDFAELFRRAASQVDQILRGAHPGDIPFEQSTKFELAINLQAARSLGLSVPQRLLVSADEVIE